MAGSMALLVSSYSVVATRFTKRNRRVARITAMQLYGAISLLRDGTCRPAPSVASRAVVAPTGWRIGSGGSHMQSAVAAVPCSVHSESTRASL